MNVRNSVLELIAQTEKDLTFAKGAAGLTAIENRLVNLNEAAKEQNLSDESKIDDFARFRTNRREGIETEKIAAEKELLLLEQKLASAGIKSVKSTAAHKLVAEAYANWIKALDHPQLKTGEDPKKVLADHYIVAYNEMRRAAQMAKDIAGDDNQFQTAVTEGKRGDARGKFRDVFDDIHRMLNELEAMGVDVSKDRALLPAKLEDSAITTELGTTADATAQGGQVFLRASPFEAPGAQAGLPASSLREFKRRSRSTPTRNTNSRTTGTS